jgi:ADP-ribose pyrophosphatase YjhB (NUDIX family)
MLTVDADLEPEGLEVGRGVVRDDRSVSALVGVARKPLGAAAVVLDGQGRVLLVKHSYGPLNWELPGGAAEPDESITETALREVREETVLRVAAGRLTGVYYDPAVDMHHFVFACRRLDEAQQPRPTSEEVTACAFLPPEALPRPISDFTARRIADARSGASQPLPVVVEPRRWLD